jgi:hypothetical protein
VRWRQANGGKNLMLAFREYFRVPSRAGACDSASNRAVSIANRTVVQDVRDVLRWPLSAQLNRINHQSRRRRSLCGSLDQPCAERLAALCWTAWS